MPPFKLNPNAQAMTLDSRHNEYLRKFKEDEETVIPAYQAEIAALQERFKTRPKEEAQIKDQIRLVETTVQKLEEERLNYLLSNSKHIYGYFDEAPH
jgi:predicted nuclease with TOPRIM domain